MSPVVVRPATDADLWPIVEAVARAGETCAWPRDVAAAARRTL